MGQQLFKAHLDIKENSIINSNTISSDDISFFFPGKNSSDPTINPDQQISSLQTEYIKQIRNHLFQLTKSAQWEEIENEIKEKFIVNIQSFINNQIEKFKEERDNHSTYKQQLQTSFTTKLKADENKNLSIFAQNESKQLSYFAIQSLTSILLILIKSAERNDPTLVHQILTLTNQLCEQLPMKCLYSSNSLLFKSLEPLTNYIQELSVSTDSILSKQTIQIQLSFSIAKGSFKDLLPLLNKLIFNTHEVFHMQGLIIQMNNYLTKTMEEYGENNNGTGED
jgi:hypothetical protein